MHEFGFHPLVDRWFRSRFEAPTEPQRLGWPQIAAGEHTLIAAPTGSGKTLTAFLAVIDRLLKDAIAGRLEDGMRVVYISPLRALSNDMHRNLTEPLAELNALAAAEFPDAPIAEIRAGLRTGDTTSSQRAALVRKPPHILVTTPESLFLLLTAEKGRAALKTADTIIIDEIHALIRDKRGSHLALSVERLEALCERRLQRIGLSATQKPIERVGRFLVGGSAESQGVRAESDAGPGGTPRASGDGRGGETDDASDKASTTPCVPQSVPPSADSAFRTPHSALPTIVDVGHSRELDLAIEVPPSELSAVCSSEQWGEVNERIVELINSHRATLIFVNTRRMAERVTHQLTELLGEDQVGSHHGSLSTDIRLRTEQRLKDGQLKAVVATASLELGLDVGYIDLVIQIGSPRAIATFLQRIGRSGHSLGKTPKGRLFALTRDELIECMALVRAIRAGRLDVVPIPENGIDVLAQQIVGEVACREWDTDGLFALFGRAWPYRNLSREDFDETLRFLSEGLSERSDRSRVYLHHDLVQKRVRARPGARIAATSNAGAIPEVAEFRVLAQPDNVVVGTLDEDFAVESHVGQIVLLGNTSWRMEGVRGTDVMVSDAGGAPPTIPFWRGEAPGRTVELSEEVGRLREEVEAAIKAAPEAVVAETWNECGVGSAECGIEDATETDSAFRTPHSELVTRLCDETSTSPHAARQVVDYVAAQLAAVGVVPTQKRVIFERFFDETGGMQMVVHAPFGSRITHAWGLAMRKRFCVSFDFELQATADDEGFILSLGPQHSFPLESMFPMLNRDNVRELLKQAILYIPMFQIRWRWNMNRALLVPRRDKGKRIPPALQRFRSDDLMTSVFPMLTGCQENVSGPLELPDHILLRQTMEDCLTEALDIEGLEDVLGQVTSGEIEFVARDTREPSPFSYELLNSNPYAFLDGGELAERRARAVSTPRSLSIESASDLGRLDPLAIEQVVNEAQPLIRNADELHDLLLTRLLVREDELLHPPSGRVAVSAAGRDFEFDDAGRPENSPEQGVPARSSRPSQRESEETTHERIATQVPSPPRSADEYGEEIVAGERVRVRGLSEFHQKTEPPHPNPLPRSAASSEFDSNDRGRGGSLSSAEIVHELADRRPWLIQLASQRRATRLLITVEPAGTFWAPAERLPAVLAMFPDAKLDPPIETPAGVRLDWNNVDSRIAAVRGLIETCGPISHIEAAPRVGLSPEQTFACLEALEGEGLVLRGRFRPGAAKSDDVEWCHRRLLSRIHRLTLDGLRKQIQPVTVDTFFRFLIRHHGLTSDSRRAGVNGLFETISILQGLDIPAASWERDILPARLGGYRSEWLDELCLGGEVAWGRLFPPKRDSESRSGVTRVVPVSLFLRSDQDWLTAASPLDETALTATAQATVELLADSGATFAADLQQRLGLTGGTFQDVLGELITAGVLTADGFGGLRGLLAEKGNTTSSLSRRRGLVRRRAASGSVGRWSLWRTAGWVSDPTIGKAVVGTESQPTASGDDEVAERRKPSGQAAGLAESPDGLRRSATSSQSAETESVARSEVVEQWAWQLLRRWGVVFRELLDKEAGAPRWWELLQIYRRLEARGELRGGRFISGVAGEQFALPDTVKRLRELRDNGRDSRKKTQRSQRTSARIRDDFLSSLNGDAAPPGEANVATRTNPQSSEWVVLSAADPLNLVGIITEHGRVHAFAHNRIAFHKGRPVAALVKQEVVLLERLSLALRDRVAAVLAGAAVGAIAESPPVDEGSLPEATAPPATAGRKFVRPVIG